MIYIKISGILNLLTALIHLFAGQVDLVQPLLQSDLLNQQKGEFVGVWHMVTIFLFFTAILLLRVGFARDEPKSVDQLKSISLLYILFGIPFIAMSIYYELLIPQWILLMPIGILLQLGINKIK